LSEENFACHLPLPLPVLTQNLELENWNFSSQSLLDQFKNKIIIFSVFIIWLHFSLAILYFKENGELRILKWFYRVQELRFSSEKCGQIYPTMKFFEQNFKSCREIEQNHYFSQFCCCCTRALLAYQVFLKGSYNTRQKL
jgi:hypothetical protein